MPIAGVEHGYLEASWFFFSIGIVFWLVLMTIMFYRCFFHHPLPDRMVPTLFILVAPPAVGFLAYVRLGGEVDGFARVLNYSGLFLFLLLVAQVRSFSRLTFFLSWWAYSFPIAALTLATMVMAEAVGGGFYRSVGALLLGLLTALVALLAWRTYQQVRSGAVFQPD